MNKETYVNGVLKVQENLKDIKLKAKKLKNGKAIQIASEEGMTFKRIFGQPGQYMATHPMGASTDDVIAGLDMLVQCGYVESYQQFLLDFQIQFKVNEDLSKIQGREIFYNPPDSTEFQRLARIPRQEVVQQLCCYLNASVLLRTIPFHTSGSEPKVDNGVTLYEGEAGRGWLNYIAAVAGPGDKISIGMSPSWLHTGRARNSRNAVEKSFGKMVRDAKIPTVITPAKGWVWRNHFGLNVNADIRGYYIDVEMHDGIPMLTVVSTKQKENSSESRSNPTAAPKRGRSNRARIAKAARGSPRRR